MAQIINKQDRIDVLTAVIREAFEPRFNEILDEYKALMADNVARAHPEFLALYAVEANRKYLAYSTSKNVVESGAYLYRPGAWGERATRPRGRGYASNHDNVRRMSAGDIPSPDRESTPDVENADLRARYDAVWADYEKAFDMLSGVLHSYRTIEALAADFPELAKHISPRQKPAKLPSVNVGDIRKQLAKVGVPPKV